MPSNRRTDHRQPDYSPQTDLAIESFDAQVSPPGINIATEQSPGITVTRVQVLDETGAQQVGKPPGNYVTIEAPGLLDRSRDLQEKVAAALAQDLSRLLNLPPDAHVFVVGLGNWRATPDALGPQVMERLLVTRHLEQFVPADVKGRLRPVSALAPGVLGITGIETGEIIRGIVARIQPDAIIAVDALAARGLGRMLTTVQIADTGIHPGSGVGNHRAGITNETMGVPVIAIGVPTVVQAATIAHHVVDVLLQHVRELNGQQNQAYSLLRDMEDSVRRAMVEQVLTTSVGPLMVTPKEIDVHIEQMADVVAAGINQALHPGVETTDLADALRI